MSKREKAERLVAEKRIHIGWVSNETNGTERPIAAAGLVEGDTGNWRCSYSPFGRVCECPAGRTWRDCSHAIALEMAVAEDHQIQLELLYDLPK